MRTKTKIICTMGPAVDSVEMIEQLVHAGMNVARLNFSHGDHETHGRTIQLLKEVRERLAVPLAIMLDTKGPEIRLGVIDGGFVKLEAGQRLLVMKKPVLGNDKVLSISPISVLDDVAVGMRILFDDGYIATHVVEIRDDSIMIEVDNGGILKSGKGVNIPSGRLHLPSMTENDRADIRFGCEQDVDLIAASFVRSADDILNIKKLLAELKRSDIQVMAKIENAEGVANIDSIIQVADGVMIARGDLGVEVPLSKVPALQKMMIRKSYLAGKPSITATQMLESMIHNPRPTRAEVSDVANAIYDSTSAVMLSGETAIGRYPIETVKVMRSIVEEAESDFSYRLFFEQHSTLVYHDVPSALTLAAVKTAYSTDSKAILAFTSGGGTARLLSRLRPQMPIIAMTPYKKSYHQMAANWGVIPFLNDSARSIDEAFKCISQFALEQKLVSYGDLVVVTAGTPFGVAGTTNMMLVESIGNVLVRGHEGSGQRVYGKVALVLSPESRLPYSVRDQLVVITRCDESYRALINESSGVILQNHIDDVQSVRHLWNIVKELDKPAIVRADAASTVLKEGQLVTMDPEKALVYKGVVL